MVAKRRSFGVAGLLAGCALLAATGCGGSDPLVQVDTEKAANRILVALADVGIDGQKKITTVQRERVFQIIVADADVGRARRMLVLNDLPRAPQVGFAGMLKSSGLIPTKTDERARLMNAIAGELSETLETVDGIIRARVHIVLADDNPLAAASGRARPLTASAAVLLKYAARPGSEAARRTAGESRVGDAGPADAPLRADAVRSLVAGSVEGLDEKRVTVEYTRAGAQRARSPERGPSGTAASQPSASASRLGDDLIVYGLAGIVVVLGLVLIMVIARLRSAKLQVAAALASGKTAVARARPLPRAT